MDFGNIIGGPLQAAVEAQSLSAKATLQFIMSAGFNNVNSKYRMYRVLEKEAGANGYEDKAYYQLTHKQKDLIGNNDNKSPQPLYIQEDGQIVTFAKIEDKKNQKYYEIRAPEPRCVSFSYRLKDSNEEQFIKVPLLTLLPIPYISIQSIDLDFTAKITAAKSATSDLASQYDSSTNSDNLGARVKFGRRRASYMQASYYSKNKKTNSKSGHELTMDVKVRAVNGDIPVGLSRILGILESTI